MRRRPQTNGVLAARDAQICRRCQHRCASHGSYTDGGFIGIGRAACGLDGCRCPRFAGRHFYPDESRYRPIDYPEAWLRMLCLPTPGRYTDPEGWADTRTSMADLRTALVIDRGDVGTYRLCPTFGFDLATAVYGLPWCCAHGRHPGLRLRTYRVQVVAYEVDADTAARTVLVTLDEEVVQVLDPDDWDAWHDWTAARVYRWLRESGGLIDGRRVHAFTVDLDRHDTSGWRGLVPLGASVEMRIEAGVQAPITAAPWRTRPGWCPERGR